MSDKYCYPGTAVLKNKYNIKNRKLLDELEVQKVSIKLLGLSYDSNRVLPTCDSKHLKELHKYLFFDLYPWAGHYREENFFKAEKVLSGASVEYCNYNDIETELEKLFKIYNADVWKNKENIVSTTVDFLTKLWIVHPFREGNTRTCITFLWQYLKEHNITLNVNLLKNNPHYVRDSLVMSSYDNRTYLSKIISDALDDKVLLSLDNVIETAHEQYQIAKEEYQAFKEKYVTKNLGERKTNQPNKE